jgi:hypothetical protein
MLEGLKPEPNTTKTDTSPERIAQTPPPHTHLLPNHHSLNEEPAKKSLKATMAQYGSYPPQGQQQQYGAAQNLQFYPSQYPTQPVSGHSTPFQAYSGNAQPNSYDNAGFGGGFAQPGVTGRMGEQGGLRTGWLAAFGTEGYDGEPPLLEELGVNFSHIKLKVCRCLL